LIVVPVSGVAWGMQPRSAAGLEFELFVVFDSSSSEPRGALL
jgi:hypothetical protein